MFSHAPELISPVGCFESTCVIEQYLKSSFQGRLPDLHLLIVLGLTKSTSSCFLLAEEPRHAEHSPSDQDTIYLSFSNPTHAVGKTLHVAVTEQERTASSHDVGRSRNGSPVRFATIHLL